jgi:hypothetical protein
MTEPVVIPRPVGMALVVVVIPGPVVMALAVVVMFELAVIARPFVMALVILDGPNQFENIVPVSLYWSRM